jgi:hypothetical protein
VVHGKFSKLISDWREYFENSLEFIESTRLRSQFTGTFSFFSAIFDSASTQIPGEKLKMEAGVGIEPTMGLLQSPALPLG